MLEALPTLIYYKEGKEVDRTVGSLDSKSLDGYINLIKWEERNLIISVLESQWASWLSYHFIFLSFKHSDKKISRFTINIKTNQKILILSYLILFHFKFSYSKTFYDPNSSSCFSSAEIPVTFLKILVNNYSLSIQLNYCHINFQS